MWIVSWWFLLKYSQRCPTDWSVRWRKWIDRKEISVQIQSGDYLFIDHFRRYSISLSIWDSSFMNNLPSKVKNSTEILFVVSRERRWHLFLAHTQLRTNLIQIFNRSMFSFYLNVRSTTIPQGKLILYSRNISQY